MSERDDLAALIKDAYYHARDNGGTMHSAADDAANAVIAAGWVPEWEYTDLVKRTGVLDLEHAHFRAERDALAATVQRVRDAVGRLDSFVLLRKQDHANDAYNQGVARAVEDLRAALTPEPTP